MCARAQSQPTSENSYSPTLGEKRSGRAGGWSVRARPGNGFDCTRERPAGALMGIMFPYVQISMLVLVAYIRNTLRPGTGAKRRAGPTGHKSAAKGIIEAGAPAFGCTVHPLRLQAPRAAYAHKSPGQGHYKGRSPVLGPRTLTQIVDALLLTRLHGRACCVHHFAHDFPPLP